MLLKNRVIWSDNGVLKDISDNLNNHISGSNTLPLVAAQDYIFLGSEAPFNHRWFQVTTPNAVACSISVELWDGSSWQAVAEVIDLTKNSAGDTTLSRSGILAWVPDKQLPSWNRDDTVDGGGNVITGLSSVKIYNLYWARLSFSANVTAGLVLAYIGHKFANDEDLFSQWPEFATSEALARFKAGITTFDQVHFEAAKEIIRDLKADKVINSSGQVLDWESFRLPAIHKAAELIYNAYGSDWKAEQALVSQRYKNAMDADLFNIDLNSNASLDVAETKARQGRLYR